VIIAVLDATHQLAHLAGEWVLASARILLSLHVHLALAVIRTVGLAGRFGAIYATEAVLAQALALGQQASTVARAIFGASLDVTSVARETKNALTLALDAGTLARADLTITTFAALHVHAVRQGVARPSVLGLLAVALAETIAADTVVRTRAVTGTGFLTAVGLQATILASAHAGDADAVPAAVIGASLLRAILGAPLLDCALCVQSVSAQALSLRTGAVAAALVRADLGSAVGTAIASEASAFAGVMLTFAVAAAVAWAIHARAVLAQVALVALAHASLGIASAIATAIPGTAHEGAVRARKSLVAAAYAGLVVALAAVSTVALAQHEIARRTCVADIAATQAGLGVALADTTTLNILNVGWASFELAVSTRVAIRAGANHLDVAVACFARGDAALAVKARARLLAAGRAIVT